MPETDRRRDATLAPVKATYETWGREDPFYAVLTSKRRRGNQWDPEVFFDRGRREVDDVIDYVDGLSLRPGTARALDFGCGVGRLTFALADRFDEVVGVDIAESMVDCARRWNDRGERVRFVANARADLSLFADDSFDFVYSSITLQHVPAGRRGRVPDAERPADRARQSALAGLQPAPPRIPPLVETSARNPRLRDALDRALAHDRSRR